ncbi:carboxypeptidase-like regulatory domain-containing protein [Flavobacterium sp.]|uniref:carboxypeptidase-like regulatory domain-containing protein n=1 Tax=Flavobacterium sp. TaxID=239 RepID=UPI00375397CF
MKKTIYLYICLISWSNFCLSQTISIQNSTTFETISFVNISLENGEGSFTSDENGVFQIPINNKSKGLIFNAIGYEELQIDIDKIKNPILLKTKSILLEEVVITKSKKKTRKIGNIKGEKTVQVLHDLTDDELKPCIIAKYFDLNNENILLKTIKIKTTSTSLNPIINFRIYSKGKDNKPDEIIYNENLFCTVEKGDRITKMDLSKLEIILPNNGFFIAVEILVTDKNKQESKYTYKNVEHIHKFYYPILKMTQTDEYVDTWYNSGKNWQKNNNLSLLMELEVEE